MPTLTPVNPIPSGYDPLLAKTQYADVLPNVTMPANKFAMTKTGDYTLSQVMAKGASVISKYSTLEPHMIGSQAAIRASGVTVDDVTRPEQAGLTPAGGGPEDWDVWTDGTQYNKAFYPNGPLTDAQAYSRGQSTDISDLIAIYEAEEGLSWIQPGHQQWRGWYRAIKERKAAKWAGTGKLPLTAHNYYTLNPFSRATSNNNGNTDGINWWTLGNATEAQVMAKFDRPTSQWERSNYLPGGTLADTNLILDGIYMDPETLRGGIMRTAFRSQICAKMGFYFGVYIAASFEYRPNNWTSILHRSSDYPGTGNYGVYFRATTLPLPPESIIAYTNIGLILGCFSNVWLGGEKRNSDKVNFGWDSHDLWYPNRYDSLGSNTGQRTQVVEGTITSRLANDYPYYMAPGYSGPLRNNSNYHIFGSNLYARTFGQTAGGVQQMCEYRVDGGAWRTPKTSIAAGTAQAYYAKDWFVMCERKDGKISIGAIKENPSDHLKHTLDIKNPANGTIYTMVLCGGAWNAVTTTE